MRNDLTLDSPTGPHDLTRVKTLAGSIYTQRGDKSKDLWFDEEDIYQDFILLLLEGEEIPHAFNLLMKKYKQEMYTVDIDHVSEKYLIDTSYLSDNVRETGPLDKKQLAMEYFRRILCLDTKSQDMILLKSIGISDKDIADKLSMTYANVRVKLHRSIMQMKGMKKK